MSAISGFCEKCKFQFLIGRLKTGYLVTLAKAREALKSVSFRSGLGSDEETIREALAAIDKIGGKE